MIYRLYLILILIVVSFSITAQTFYRKQFNHPGPPGMENFVTGITPTLDRGILISSSEMGSNGTGAFHKLDINGIPEWQYEYSGFAIGACQLKDSTFFLLTFGTNSLLTYLDKMGSIIWSKSIIDTTGTNIYPSGSITAWNDSVVLIVDEFSLLWISKSGIIQNQKPGPGFGTGCLYNDCVGRILITPQKDFYIYGGDLPIHLNRYDSLGNVMWRKTIDLWDILFSGVDLSEASLEIKQRSNGDLIITGMVWPSGTNLVSFVACIDTSAALKWVWGLTHGYATDIIIMPDNSITLAGSTFFTHLDSVNTSSLTHFKLNSGIRPSKGFYSDQMDSSYFIASSGINYFTIEKSTLNHSNACYDSVAMVATDFLIQYIDTIDPWIPPHKTYNLQDTIVVSNYLYTIQDICIINKVEDFNVETMNVFPNPVVDKLIIETNARNFQWELSDIKGSIVSRGHSSEIDLINFEKGIYVLRLITQQKSFSKKIIHMN